ncbi:MAG: chondroitin AC lyase [Saprospiraceae bacterium]|jgi:chondroitin AC lyase
MRRLLVGIILINLVFGCNQSGESIILKNNKKYSVELKPLHRNVIDNILNSTESLDEVELYLNDMRKDGSWADIDYLSKERGAWSPRSHLLKLLEIARVYQTKGNKHYQKKDVSEKIHNSLNHWLDNDFQCPNWWYPVIGVPMVLNPIMILMEAELSEDQLTKALVILNRCEIGKTGQNKVWQSGNVLLTSLLTQNTAKVEKASASIKEELVVSQNEGIQADWSYHQHGPQLQFGNYGLSYAGDMIKWITILRNTPYGFDERKVSILRNYLLEGQQWVIWKDQMNISSCGRQLFINSQESKAEKLSSAIKKMEVLDPDYSDQYVKANNYLTLSGNKHFWRSDYHIQRNVDYYFSVKMCSERVIGAESCNSENIQGYYMGDGAAFLYQSGEEFTNIFPFWDWKKIPGTTIHQDDEPLPILTCSGYRIESDFVGGVSDKQDGITVLKYIRNGLTANKSWFMLDNKIVCLGSGVSSSEGFPVTTSVSQSYLNGEVLINLKNQVKPSREREELLNPTWILHNNIGYLFPKGGNLILETKNVEGSWNSVAKRYPDDRINADIFKLWYVHGTNPKSGSYEYILVPNTTKVQLKELEVNSPFKIINKEHIQSVETIDGSKAGISFYRAGKADFLGGIEVNQACLILLKKQNNNLLLSVSDPTQKLSEIQIIIEGHYDHENAKKMGSNTIVKVQIPSGMDAGKTTKVRLVGTGNKSI